MLMVQSQPMEYGFAAGVGFAAMALPRRLGLFLIGLRPGCGLSPIELVREVWGSLD